MIPMAVLLALFALHVLLVPAGCSRREAAAPVRGDADLRRAFPDIIDHHGAPAAAEDWSLVPFADQGAWCGFALPPHDRLDLAGGFAGPFLMTVGRWLGPQLAGLELTGITTVRAVSLPGLLVREWSAGALRIVQTLWFDTSHTALIRSRIHNHGAAALVIEPTWTGEVFPEVATLEAADAGVFVRTNDGDRLRLVVDRAAGEVSITGSRYRLPLAEPLGIAAGDSATLTLAISLTVAGDSEPDPVTALAAVDADTVDASFARNVGRWHRYLAATGDRAPTDPVRILAVKCIQTLVNNWRGAAGRLHHGGLFPSSNVWYFNGFWAWDSWKHAVALAHFDTGIAGDQLRLMFDHQDDLGMIADVVYLDASEDNWRNTKPPLAGWALEKVFQRSGDIELVRELYPRLETYHDFWYAHRDHDRDGLCEYGSTDGTIVAARWESGMDNAVRFDHTEMLRNGPRAWSMNQESVDLNCYLYREKRALQLLAAALGETADAERWAVEAAALRERIRTDMFDEAAGWFHDIHIDTGAVVPVQGPEGWTPLWAEVATEQQAARLRVTMLDTLKFRTRVPFPTVARDHPEFSAGYWRGLVWLDQVYFAVAGLRAYGYDADADILTRQVLFNLAGATERGRPLYENYHPLTGEGHNVKHFSWTAAHLLLLALTAR